MIAPEINSYGKYSRVSFVADYLELLALRRVRVSRATVADYILDANWDLETLFATGESDPTEDMQDAAADASETVYSVLAERAQILGRRYPFTIDERGVSRRPRLNAGSNPYVALLAITLAHAYEIALPRVAHQLFEQTVAEVFALRGLSTSNFGLARRDCATFPEALDVACTHLGLVANIEGVPRKKYAQDERVDLIALIPWGDRRVGCWSFIGQVTCARSDEWDRKINEPAPSTWGHFLTVTPEPAAFLAVPHHAETAVLGKIVRDRGRVIVDRLRLTAFKKGVSAEERAAIDAVLAQDVEKIA